MRNQLSAALFLLGVFVTAGAVTMHECVAQQGTVLQAEGISGDIDKKRRSPAVSIEAFYVGADSEDAATGGARGRILVDAYIPNPDYEKYPIRVDYYINRNFFTSQMRSTELPGPLGIDIGPDRATPPFNYTVVATLLHPNREFTTVMHGAIFSSNFRPGIASCSLTVTRVGAGTGNSTEKTTYVSDDVKVIQTGNESFSVAFESSKLQDGSSVDTVSTSGVFTISENSDGENKAIGTLTTTAAGSTGTTEVEGSATFEGPTLSGVSLENEDKSTALSCQ